MCINKSIIYINDINIIINSYKIVNAFNQYDILFEVK